MNIAHIGPEYISIPSNKGGAIERRIVELAREQAQHDDVHVYSVGECDSDKMIDGVRYHYVAPQGWGPFRRLCFVCDAMLRAKAFNHDIIHSHSRPEVSMYAKRAGLRSNLVLSFDFHKIQPRVYLPGFRAVSYFFTQQWLNGFSRLMGVTAWCCNVFKNYWYCDPSKIGVLPNGVDCTRMRPHLNIGAKERERLGLVGRKVVLYVGRHCQQKGTDILIDAFRIIQSRRADVALLTVGPGSQFSGRAVANPYSIALREVGATNLPPVDDDELPAIYNSCDVFVLPTRQWEMFGMVAIEAMACGKPVVVTDVGGLREIVDEDVGLRVSPGDPYALAGAIEKIVNVGDGGASFTQRCCARAEQFAWPRVATMARHVYKGIVPAAGVSC